MSPRQTLRTSLAPGHASVPGLWLVTDARTDTGLDQAVRALPRGAGVIFRHYHLTPAARHQRFRQLARLCRARGLVVVWAGSPRAARRLGADGSYGGPTVPATGPGMLRLATVHSLGELAAAVRAHADAVLISPVFATRSHPGARGLGPLRWLALARRSPVPAIALGGMTARGARRLPGFAWAAIDGLATGPRAPGKVPGNPKDS